MTNNFFKDLYTIEKQKYLKGGSSKAFEATVRGPIRRRFFILNPEYLERIKELGIEDENYIINVMNEEQYSKLINFIDENYDVDDDDSSFDFDDNSTIASEEKKEEDITTKYKGWIKNDDIGRTYSLERIINDYNIYLRSATSPTSST